MVHDDCIGLLRISRLLCAFLMSPMDSLTGFHHSSLNQQEKPMSSPLTHFEMPGRIMIDPTRWTEYNLSKYSGTQRLASYQCPPSVVTCSATPVQTSYIFWQTGLQLPGRLGPGISLRCLIVLAKSRTNAISGRIGRPGAALEPREGNMVWLLHVLPELRNDHWRILFPFTIVLSTAKLFIVFVFTERNAG
jgi:hypothetical protein